MKDTECRTLLLLRPISAYDGLELSTQRIALTVPRRAFTVTGFAFLDEKRLYAMKNILLIATGGTIASAEDGNGLSPLLRVSSWRRRYRRSRECASWISSNP